MDGTMLARIGFIETNSLAARPHAASDRFRFLCVHPDAAPV
jgi:hypothetical protein